MEAYLQQFLQKFKHLEIQLEEIKKGTNNFNEMHRIGVGGFGNVYKGEVPHSQGRGPVAIKRLGSTSQQGAPEFLKEITMLSDCKHENVISLLGFCCEESEMILVYEHASLGSLDHYLDSPQLTWRQRLKICLDAAKGLRYLHDPRETHRRLIHCDVKSGNILLDDKWNAKVADLGLAQVGSANEQHSVIVTLAAGTLGYIDPQYRMTHTLTKESDVYSFGVVLFEVLCGRVCCTLDGKGHVKEILVPKWIESYEQNNLNDVIFRSPNIEPMHQRVLRIFSSIAYKCLNKDREDRPKMAEVVTELESALDSHELFQNQEFISKWNEQHEYQEMIKTAEFPLNYKSEDELMDLMLKGVLLNGGKTWFSLNKKGEHCEMISIAECLGSDVDRYFSAKYNSRFAVGIYEYFPGNGILETHVKTQFLSPGITYTVNLVFKFQYPKNKRRCEPISLKYKLQGETENSISHLAYEREDGWWMAELYQLACDCRIVHLQILFDGFKKLAGDRSTVKLLKLLGRHKTFDGIEIEGIEFLPLEKVEHIDEKRPISDSNCEEKLPIDYEDMMKRSTYNVQWTTKDGAYLIIRKRISIHGDETEGGIWFSLDKNGKKCHMLSATLIWPSEEKSTLRISRFGEAVRFDSNSISILTEVESPLLSSETTYGCYLVYKLPKDQDGFEAPMKVVDTQWNSGDKVPYIYLVSPQTPVIRPKTDQNTHNPLSRPKMKGVPHLRNDGWMEVQICELQPDTTNSMDCLLTLIDGKRVSGLIIEGIDFRPL